jgi:hypothetical protein
MMAVTIGMVGRCWSVDVLDRFSEFSCDAVPELGGGDVDDSRVRGLEFCAEGRRTGARVSFRIVTRRRGRRGARKVT